MILVNAVILNLIFFLALKDKTVTVLEVMTFLLELGD